MDQAPSFVIAGRLEAQIAEQNETIKQLRQDVNALTSQNKSAGATVKKIKEELAQKEAEFNQFVATAGDSIHYVNASSRSKRSVSFAFK